jgi:hypothetical protein
MALMPRPIDETMLPWRGECQAQSASSEWLVLTMVDLIFVFVLLKAKGGVVLI